MLDALVTLAGPDQASQRSPHLVSEKAGFHADQQPAFSPLHRQAYGPRSVRDLGERVIQIRFDQKSTLTSTTERDIGHQPGTSIQSIVLSRPANGIGPLRVNKLGNSGNYKSNDESK